MERVTHDQVDATVALARSVAREEIHRLLTTLAELHIIDTQQHLAAMALLQANWSVADQASLVAGSTPQVGG